MILLIVVLSLAVVFVGLRTVAFLRREKEDTDVFNPYLHKEKAGEVLHGEMIAFAENLPQNPQISCGVYARIFKRFLDAFISFFGLIILSPVFFALFVAIIIDDPGPVFFKQTRVGKDMKFFKVHKFRSMKMSTPHDMPTHMLQNPEQYITGVGKFLRKLSLDELPQIWDIFRGKMSIIGPRPALWNQADLVAEREKYGVNDLYPGLTGFAQINGRDELKISEKVSYDRKYKENISFWFDVKCFFGTIVSVLKSDGVVEGGTGEIEKHKSKVGK